MKDSFGKECYGCVYKVTNLLNEKCYIGCTTTDYTKYIKNHFYEALNGVSPKKDFYNAIRDDGEENFKWEILRFCYSPEELNNSEIELIRIFRSFGSDGEI